MRLRARFLSAVLLSAVWVSSVVGVVRLFDGRTSRTELAAAGAVGGLLALRCALAARVRWRRVRSWRRPGEAALSPGGPRRVLLTETALARRR